MIYYNKYCDGELCREQIDSKQMDCMPFYNHCFYENSAVAIHMHFKILALNGLEVEIISNAYFKVVLLRKYLWSNTLKP